MIIAALKQASVYLISTAIANQAKDKFYNEDIPMLENVRAIPTKWRKY